MQRKCILICSHLPGVVVLMEIKGACLGSLYRMLKGRFKNKMNRQMNKTERSLKASLAFRITVPLLLSVPWEYNQYTQEEEFFPVVALFF